MLGYRKSMADILVVEDSRDVNALLVETLAAEGHAS